MVPTFTCGFVRSNFFFAIAPLSPSVSPPRGSNPRPRPYQGRALPTELGGQSSFSGHEKRVAWRNSLEPLGPEDYPPVCLGGSRKGPKGGPYGRRRKVRPPPCTVPGALVRVTVKELPSAPSVDGCAIACPARLIIATAVAPRALRVCVFPSRTALPPVKRTVPKSSRGMMPRPALGASWT